MSEFVDFYAEDSATAGADDQPPWLIAVIDDEPAVFDATQIALDGNRFEGRPFKLIYAASAKEGRHLLATTPDIACVLLDVVMETEHAGLDLVRQIREEMGNSAVRIILRTGQPGYAPPVEVIRQYDINDYKEKSELTRTRLWTSIACALRSYAQIMALEMNRRGLQMVIRASSELMRRKGIADFACGVVTQLAAHLGLPADGLVCVRQAPADREALVVGAAGKFAAALGRPLRAIDDPKALATISRALESRSEVTGSNDIALPLKGDDWIGAIYAKGCTRISPPDNEMLRLYCQNVSLGFDNARLFETISNLAFVDRLTELASRARLEQTIDELTAAGRRIGVLAMDIDGFSDYSTAFGSEFGDTVLQAMAERLIEIKPDRRRAARLFADVFALVLQDGELDRLDELIAAVARPLWVAGREFQVGLTFGFAGPADPPLPEEQSGGQALIRRAEMALKEAVQSRRGSLAVFSPRLEEKRSARMLLAHDLRSALDGQEVFLHYQPQVDVDSGRVIAVEALMRWQHPVRGRVAPPDFIGAAESSGVIFALGQWVTRRACREMRRFLDEGLIDRVTINLSPVQLRDPNCLAELHRIVEEEGIAPQAVEWEITESAVLAGEAAIAQLGRAREQGYTIALDDFGTGYSSLSMIQSIPLDAVKIDRSFLLDGAARRHSPNILRSVTAICEDLGLAIIAEGVETDEHLQVIRDARIHYAQGYLYARPEDPDGLDRWLRRRTH